MQIPIFKTKIDLMRMKTLFPALLSFLPLFLLAQNTILPLTGAKIFSNGLSAKSIEISIDGYILTSDLAPINKEVVFKLLVPKGFVTDATKKSFPAAEVTITSMAGVLLGKTADAYAASGSGGFTADKFKELIIKTGLDASIIKSNTAVNISITLTDKKSKNNLKIIFPVKIATASQGLKASAGVTQVKTEDNDILYANNLKIKKADAETDNEIKVNPLLSYGSLELKEITGASLDEIAGGKESYFVYDTKSLEQIKKTDKLLKRIKGSLEGDVSSYLLKIPYKLKTDKAAYIVRFRWESKDGKRIIDGVFEMK